MINLTVLWASICLVFIISYIALGIYAIQTANKLRRQIAICDAERTKHMLERPLLGVVYPNIEDLTKND